MSNLSWSRLPSGASGSLGDAGIPSGHSCPGSVVDQMFVSAPQISVLKP